MTALFILVAILGLAFLMVVHEGGHFLVARHFGMRVTRFSIGFGPAIYKKKPKGSHTTYQIAIIPFLAYVQIAGMNPFEESDPNDKGSYANASLRGRILTIFAGPLANYLVASVLFFIAFMVGGQKVWTTTISKVHQDTPAAAANIQPGDTVLRIEGQQITDWEQIRQLISSRPGQTVEVIIERNGKEIPLKLVPKPDKNGRAIIGISPARKTVPISTGKAALAAIEEPPRIVAALVVGIGQMIARRLKPELAGPVGIVREMAEAMRRGFEDYMALLGALSAYLAGFNLLPFPALDGGRLMFLGYEAATRKRPNAKVEAHVHAVGLIMLLTLVAFVTVFSDLSGSSGP